VRVLPVHGAVEQDRAYPHHIDRLARGRAAWCCWSEVERLQLLDGLRQRVSMPLASTEIEQGQAMGSPRSVAASRDSEKLFLGQADKRAARSAPQARVSRRSA